MNEFIVCSAIWYKDISLINNNIPSDLLRPFNCDRGIVFCGLRHPHCLYQMVAMTGKRQCEAGEEIQGFITNKWRFIDRIEGLEIAKVADQIITSYNLHQLHSEDLW